RRPGPGTAAGRAVWRPLRLLLVASRLSRVSRPPGRAPARRHLPGDGRGKAAPGGLLHRRSASRSPVAALPAGDARRLRVVVVRRDRLSLARGGGGAKPVRTG